MMEKLRESILRRAEGELREKIGAISITHEIGWSHFRRLLAYLARNQVCLWVINIFYA